MLHPDKRGASVGASTPQGDGYWSDDRNLQLRELAPEQCRGCQHLMVKDSIVLSRMVMDCGVVDQRAATGAILATVLLRLAKAGHVRSGQRFSSQSALQVFQNRITPISIIDLLPNLIS